MEKYIQLNKKYYPVELLDKKIKWEFICDQNLRNFAHFSSSKDKLFLNVLAIADAVENREEMNVEFFILHEIRHIYQNFAIDKYLKDGECLISEELLKRWIKEKKNYVKAFDGKKELNTNHFKQDLEKDAYAFACGVLLEKYGTLPSYLYIKRENIYGQEFYNIVECWATGFGDNSEK